MRTGVQWGPSAPDCGENIVFSLGDALAQNPIISISTVRGPEG